MLAARDAHICSLVTCRGKVLGVLYVMPKPEAHWPFRCDVLGHVVGVGMGLLCDSCEKLHFVGASISGTPSRASPSRAT